jgi:hypothetical protein
MDKCSRCGADTERHENGVPICIECSEKNRSCAKAISPREIRTARTAIGKAVGTC